MKQMIGELSYDRFLSIAIFGNELRMSAEPQGPLISYKLYDSNSIKI